jgi:hypothetical protein
MIYESTYELFYRNLVSMGKKLHWIRNGFCSKKMKIYMLCLSLIFDVERHETSILKTYNNENIVFNLEFTIIHA